MVKRGRQDVSILPAPSAVILPGTIFHMGELKLNNFKMGVENRERVNIIAMGKTISNK